MTNKSSVVFERLCRSCAVQHDTAKDTQTGGGGGGGGTGKPPVFNEADFKEAARLYDHFENDEGNDSFSFVPPPDMCSKEISFTSYPETPL